jgi:hypothetical protein
MIVASVLAFILPGLGHIYVGRRAQGYVFLAVITATFWGGVAIGGVRSTVDSKQHRAWFAAQVLNGGYTAAVLTWQRQLPQVDARTKLPLGLAIWPADEIAMVYTGVAGLLNLLLIIDVSARASSPSPSPAKSPKGAGGGGG